MRTTAALALIAALAAAGCKDKQQAPAPAPGAPAAARPQGPRPSLPEGSAAPEGTAGSGAKAAPAPEQGARPTKPITIDEASPMVPALTGPALIPLKQTSDQQQVHGTWCLDGTSADDVAKQVAQLLAAARYTNVSVRGDAKKAGVMADRDGMRFSMVVSASSAAVCAAPAHYFASATIFKL